MHITHSSMKYVGWFGVGDHYTVEVIAFVGDRIERGESTTVLIQTGDLTTL